MGQNRIYIVFHQKWGPFSNHFHVSFQVKCHAHWAVGHMRSNGACTSNLGGTCNFAAICATKSSHGDIDSKNKLS